MKILLERHWDRNVICPECQSYLRIDEGDLRMTSDHKVHVTCLVCDSRFEVENVPNYVFNKLKSLLDKKVALTG